MAYEKDPNEIGALWEKSGAKGPYMTGTIGGQAVVLFRTKSDNPKAPTWRVMKSQPRDQKDTVQAASITDQDVPF